MMFPSELLQFVLIYTFATIGFLSLVSTIYDKCTHYFLLAIKPRFPVLHSRCRRFLNSSEEEDRELVDRLSKIMKNKMKNHIDKINDLDTKRVLLQWNDSFHDFLEKADTQTIKDHVVTLSKQIVNYRIY